jgi:hypothetical protein
MIQETYQTANKYYTAVVFETAVSHCTLSEIYSISSIMCKLL